MSSIVCLKFSLLVNVDLLTVKLVKFQMVFCKSLIEP